jgi:hypothetical protein
MSVSTCCHGTAQLKVRSRYYQDSANITGLIEVLLVLPTVSLESRYPHVSAGVRQRVSDGTEHVQCTVSAGAAGSTILCENPAVPHRPRNSPQLTEHDSSFPSSQHPATCPYRGQDQSHPGSLRHGAMFSINTQPAVLDFVPANCHSIQAVSSAAYDAVTTDN